MACSWLYYALIFKIMQLHFTSYCVNTRPSASQHTGNYGNLGSRPCAVTCCNIWRYPIQFRLPVKEWQRRDRFITPPKRRPQAFPDFSLLLRVVGVDREQRLTLLRPLPNLVVDDEPDRMIHLVAYSGTARTKCNR